MATQAQRDGRVAAGQRGQRLSRLPGSIATVRQLDPGSSGTRLTRVPLPGSLWTAEAVGPVLSKALEAATRRASCCSDAARGKGSLACDARRGVALLREKEGSLSFAVFTD